MAEGGLTGGFIQKKFSRDEGRAIWVISSMLGRGGGNPDVNLI
jgi:hypothetical protein